MRSSIQTLKEDIIEAFPFLPSEMVAANYYTNDTTGLVAKNKVNNFSNCGLLFKS